MPPFLFLTPHHRPPIRACKLHQQVAVSSKLVPQHCSPVFLDQGHCCPHPSKDIWRCLETFLVVTLRNASTAQRPGILLTSSSDKAAPQQNYPHQMPTVPRWRALLRALAHGRSLGSKTVQPPASSLSCSGPGCRQSPHEPLQSQVRPDPAHPSLPRPGAGPPPLSPTVLALPRRPLYPATATDFIIS